MDLETYTKEKKLLKLREELMSVEEDRLHGTKDYSVEEVVLMMRKAIAETSNNNK